MKRNIAGSALAGLLLFTLVVPRFHHPPRVKAQAACGVSTLQGMYGMRMEGWVSSSDAPASMPIAQIGWAQFDGAGNVTSTNVTSVNGQSSRDTLTFTYQVNPDCSGSVTPTPGSDAGAAAFTIVDGGKQAFIVVTEKGATMLGVMVRQ